MSTDGESLSDLVRQIEEIKKRFAPLETGERPGFSQGTWTPILGTESGASGQTYSTQVGTYTKIGRLVVAEFSVILSAKGTLPGTYIAISGLPFAVSSTLAHGGVSLGYIQGMAGNMTYMSGYANAGTAYFFISGSASASANLAAALAKANLTDTTGFIGAFTYMAAA